MKKTNYNKIAKRAVSAVTALVMLSGVLPLEELPRGIKLFNFEKRIVAHAVSDTTPDIGSYKQLEDYSLAYKEYEHQNDTITIAIDSGSNTALLTNFESIGTAAKPFAGKIVINSNSFYNFNLGTAFFDYVYDYVTVEVQGTGRVFTINTESNNPGAVFANHVVHDTRDSVTYDPDDPALVGDSPTKTLVKPASWSIKVADSLDAPTADPPRTSHPSDHSSLIGEIGESAELTVSIINDSTSPFSSSTGNVGTICGTMERNSKLTVASVTGSNTAAVTATAGNAGGLVGEMKSGSELTVKSLPGTAAITSNNGYAGGLVGKNDSATVTISGTPPSISNTVSGTSGAGGLFGYYKPIMTSSTYSLTLNDFSIGTSSERCTVKSTGGAGGFFGVLDNPGGTITLSGSSGNTIYTKGDGKDTIFGGIIGKYQATGISDTLKIQGTATATPITVNATKTGSDTTAYGGVIGKVDGACFTSITDVDVTAASSGDMTFGGAVGIADTGYTYVNNFKLNTSDSEAHGGGVVGSCANGVVHLSGSTNIRGAKFKAGSSSYGQIVGSRDSALVFADSSWKLTRSDSTNTVDDIGSWGEVVRFKSSGFTIESVLDNYYHPTDYPTTHYAKLKRATFNDGNNTKISIGSKSTFATAALNMQLNGGTNSDVLKFDDTTSSTYTALKSKNIVLTADVDLHHTGMTGLTRDNGSTNYQYYGSEIDAGYEATEEQDGVQVTVNKEHKLTLAIGEYYEGDDTTTNKESAGKGMIYTHQYNGLFGETSSAFTAKNIIISGEVYTENRAGDDTPYYVGTVAGNAAASFSAQNVTINDSTKIKYATNGDKDILYVGGLVGKMSTPGISTIGSTTYSGTTDSSFSANISGSATNGTMYVGGVCGYVGNGGTVNVRDVKITNEVSNSGTRATQEIGGLFGVIEDGTNALVLNGIELNGLTVKGKMSGSSGSMGGLLGYSWNGVTATFDHIKVLNCTLDNDTSTGNMAGLVYTGSGYWKFNSVEIGSHTDADGDTPAVDVNGITMSGSAAASLGMLVNKAYSNSKAMYLELPTRYTYKIYNVTGTAPTLYDEIAVYTAMPDTAIEANGNSIISINTNGTTKYGTQTDTKVNMTSGSCNTYQNQVTAFNTVNPNSRYYYNLDNYKAKASLNAAENLFLYSVKKYAHSTISGNFTATTSSTFADGTGTDTLDLDGYSYYPFDVDADDTISLSGTVILHNNNIETQELNEATGMGDNSPRSTRSATQHYLMHAGLFRNVSGTININGALSLDGTVPSIGDYCGAIICGTISGSTDADAKISSKNGSISLNGIMIGNYTAPVEGSTTLQCAPLLINNAGSCVKLEIYNVSADSTKYSSGDKIASSLIGNVGTDTAREVKISFGNIKLDGRTPANSAESGLTAVYGTSCSLFRNATLLESLSYVPSSGSYGTYNYEYSEDWGQTNGSDNRKVTYGFEISDSNSTNFQKEFWYFGQDVSSSTAYYTHAISGSYQGNSVTPTPYDFSGFRPYVYVSCNKIENPSLQHQLDVNHPTGSFSGCGTYNHPFTFAATVSDSSGGLSTIEKILNNRIANDTSIKLNLPDDISTPDRWCDNSKTDCREYSFDGNNTFSCTYENNGESVTKTWTLQQVRTYLAGAYYYVSTNIEAGSDYQGLGNTSDDYAVFHGVIVGNGTIITNKSANPLIVNSYGSVIKNLTVKVENTNLSVTGAKFDYSSGCGAYGAVIGKVSGGDNIIDKVSVQFDSTTKITPSGSEPYLAPIGGYIGVVIDGGVVFKNMNLVTASNRTGLTDSNFSTPGKIGDTNTAFLYCNPIIGRVIDGYAVNESDAYRPFEDGTRSLGDGSKEYWQSDGTIVTKTKAQFDADPTLDATMKRSAVGVTMENGNKNYSITDIDPDPNSDPSVLDMLDVTSGNAINVPNSQSFFIMSLIVNSGMGVQSSASSTDTGVIGYYKTNTAVHHATYNYVGTTDDLSDSTTADYKDYYLAAQNDAIGTDAVPYLIKNYTKANSSSYYAKTLGNGTFTLELKDNIILPDGYKGIGNFYQNDNKLRLALSTFDGKSKSISQNTTNYCYHPTLDNYVPAYGNTHLHKGTSEAWYSSAVGLGLFNCQTQYGTYKDFTLQGNVIGIVYHNDGTKYHGTVSNTDYTYIVSHVNHVNIQSTGSLFGTVNYLTTNGDTLSISNVNLNNVDVQAAKHAGGMIGFVPLNSAYNGSWDNKMITVINNANSSKIKVTAGMNAGGLIGFYYMGSVNIDFNGNHFDISRIESESAGRDTKSNDGLYADEWDCGCGGLVGVIRCNSANPITDSGISSNKAIIKNTIIGVTDQISASTVSNEKAQTSSNPFYVGGVFGVLNRAPMLAQNLTINNLSVYGKSYTGGIVGWAGTYSQATFVNTNMYSNGTAKAIVENNVNKGQVGGFVGLCKESAAETRTFTVMNSSIKGYTISHYNKAGGVLGGWKTSSFPFNIKNFEISDCIIKTTVTGNANSYVGGIVADLSSASKGLQGYNILANNLTLQSSANPGYQKKGAVCGNISNSVIKIAGFSYQSDTTLSTDKVIGSGTNGTNGYIIYADYNGSATKNGKNTSFSSVNDGDNVTNKIVYKSVDLQEIQNSDGVVKRNRTYGYDSNGRGISVTSGENSLMSGETVTKYVITKSGSTYTIKKSVNGGAEEITTSTSLPTDYPTTWRSNNYTATLTVTEIVIDGTNAPYVTVNPSITIDNIDGETGLLTGDGISQSAVNNILADISVGTSNKRYQNSGVTITNNLWDSTNSRVKSEIISSFSNELGGVITGKSYDFPLLIISEDAKADAVINDHLKVLTNNNLDFSNTVSGKNYGSVGGSTNIATVTIQSCTYNNGSYTLSDSAPCLKIANVNGEDKFVINTDSNGKYMYDTSVETGQFTLIDVAFKDPENTQEVAYHLYVPVLVKKLLEYHFDISVLSGSTYDISKYTPDSQRGKALVENLGTPITFEFEYEYLRTQDEWSKEDKDYNYNKVLHFDNTGGFNFGADTKAMLIDLNNGEKAYYLNHWTDGFTTIDPTTGEGELDLHDFKSADGATFFTPTKFSNLIESQSNATYVKEKYYLTIFTESYTRPTGHELDTVLAHYIIQSNSLSDHPEYPSRRLDCANQDTKQPHNMVHLFIGDFYTNNLSVKTTNTPDPRISANNKQIEVELSATLNIVNPSTKLEIGSYLTHPEVQLFQSFLVYFEKLNNDNPIEKGISAIDHCSANISITKQDGSVLTTQDRLVISRSHIELQNNTDISNALAAGSVTISTTATMEFNDEETRNLQFPQKADSSAESTGARVWGASNLSSQKENTAYSAVSKSELDFEGTLFYRNSDESAKLNYYADYSGATRQNQKDSQLGINGKEVELDTDNNHSSKVYTEARYDVSQMPNAGSVKYIKCEVELEQKNDPSDPESYIPVPINNYLTNLKVNGSTDAYSIPGGTRLVYILPVEGENHVETFLNEEDVYRIPIEFDVKTGKNRVSDEITSFESQSGYAYANYKINLTVSAFSRDASNDDNPWTTCIDNSRPDTDFVIFTNARIYTDLIKQVS